MSDFITTDEARMVGDALRTTVLRSDSFWPAISEADLSQIGWRDDAPELLAVLAEAVGRLGLSSAWSEAFVIAPRCLVDEVEAGTSHLMTRLTKAEAIVGVSDDLFAVKHKDAIAAHRIADDWCLNGTVGLVRPGAADQVIVRADSQDEQDLLFLVRTAQAGVERRQDLDGETVSTLTLTDTPALRLTFGGPAAVSRLRIAAWVALSAECVGACSVLLEKTLEHVRTRRQFGRTLFEFQSVQMRLAEMARGIELSRAIVRVASARRTERLALSAMIKALAVAREVWQSAVQLHGAMGTTLEGGLSRYVTRLAALEARAGTAGERLHRYADLIEQPAPRGILGDEDEDEAAFGAMVRAFLAESLTDDMKLRQAETSGFVVDPDTGQAWIRALAQQGWSAPGWPISQGGAGWSPSQQYLFQLECQRAGAPHPTEMGVRMVGPMLMQHGTDDQKARYLPAIVSGDDYWCQGYSEPGAGSDLASLATRAERDGGDYVINGSKIWTTHAQHANRMFALVRTSVDGRRQDGITFLLIDMDTPGITVVPIGTLDRSDDLNQVFFDNVRVPFTNRVGEENRGWTVAKSLLAFERSGGLAAPELRAMHEALDRPAEVGRWSALAADIEALEALELSHAMGEPLGFAAGAAASMIKLLASETRQRLSELALDLAGPAAFDGRAAGSRLMRRYLADRSHTIFGGASEIQKSLIAKAL